MYGPVKLFFCLGSQRRVEKIVRSFQAASVRTAFLYDRPPLYKFYHLIESSKGNYSISLGIIGNRQVHVLPSTYVVLSKSFYSPYPSRASGSKGEKIADFEKTIPRRQTRWWFFAALYKMNQTDNQCEFIRELSSISSEFKSEQIFWVLGRKLNFFFHLKKIWKRKFLTYANVYGSVGVIAWLGNSGG